MKKLILLALLLIPSMVFAASQTVTFSIISSAATATPNLRIAYMKPVMAQAPVAMQGMVVDSVGNYYLTKTTTITFNTANFKVIETQVAQDTKMYYGDDLTNYMLIYADVPRVDIFR